MDDPITLLAAVLLGLEAIAAVAAGAYIAWIYRTRRYEAPFLTRLIRRDLRVSVGATVIAAVVIYSLLRFAVPVLELQMIPSPWGALAIAGPVAVMLWGVIDDAIVFWRERR